MTWASGKMYNFGGRQKSQFFFFHLVRSVIKSMFGAKTFLVYLPLSYVTIAVL